MDKQFFASEVKAAERSLYRIARSYLSSDADAADAVQEALTRAWSNRTHLREIQYFRTWLTRILINVCKAFLKMRRRVEIMAEVPAGVAISTSDADSIQLRDAVRGLDVKYRIPLVLFYLDGYTISEIAQLLALPQGTVKNRLYRAREKLRVQLEEEVFDDETKRP